MSKAPAMPMYWDAYLADTTHLTTEEHGAYLLLLAAMWRRNGWVPDDDKDNARILGLTPAKWRKVKARLIETVSGFRIEEGKITQEKLQKTWEKTQEKITKNRSNGALGGRPKSSKNSGLNKANGSNSVNPNESIPEPEPEPIDKSPNGLLVEMPSQHEVAVRNFNEIAERVGWPKVQRITSVRKRALAARIKDVGGLSNWIDAMQRAADAPHLIGNNNRSWRADFDWLCKEANFTKLMEGNYDRNRQNGSKPISDNPGRSGAHDSLFSAFDAAGRG